MADQFLDLLAIDPVAGRLRANAAVRHPADLEELAFAHRALAVSARDSGDIEEALEHLEMALNIAKSLSDRTVDADIRATLGGTLVVSGRHQAGLRELELAVVKSEGLLRATILYRLGACRFMLSDPVGAARDVSDAVDALGRIGDTKWLPSALQVLGECEARLGRLDAADARLAEAQELLGSGAGYESLRLGMMRAWLSFLQGDVPGSLAKFDVDDISRIEDGRLKAETTRCLASVYLAAGLVGEAIETLQAMDAASVPPIAAAQWRAMLARSLLEDGRSAEALDLANDAAKVLQRMGLRMDAAESVLTALRAGLVLGARSDIGTTAEQVATDLTALGSRLAVDGWLLAGEIAAQDGCGSGSTRAYEAGAGFRENSDLYVAAAGWLARARALESTDDPRLLRACASGLNLLDEYGEIMGSSEMRASMTHRGRELAEVAVRHATHDPRALLSWSERWRATSLTQRPVTRQSKVSPSVAKLRDSSRLIAEARDAGAPTEALEKERRRLERKVRSEHHQQRAEASTKTKRFDPAELVATVGNGAFIELVDVDGTLHVLVVHKGRVRRVVAGETKAALELAEAGRFALRRAARTHRFAPGDLGQRFQDTVLGKAVRMLPDGPVTISPTAALHGAPFALMPALQDRPFNVVPSAAQWLRALDVPKPRTKRRALVSGPGLLTGGAEVARLAKRYPDATVLEGPNATVEATMKAIDGAKLAHLATHGTFRADSPLFSALELADGPLSVYELERLKRAPYRTILSACDSGVLAPVGAQEVLGLASALFSLGSAGLLCSIAEVNDEVTADLMMDVHATLDGGGTPAEALAAVRNQSDPIAQATAAAFVALGI